MGLEKAAKLAFVLSATDKMSRVIDDAVKKSTSRLTAFERNATKIGGSMMKAGTIMAGAGAAVGAGTFRMATAASEYGDAMWKASQSVGMGVEDIQKLAFAAKYSDVEFESLTTGMAKFNRTVADAGAGSKKSAALFKTYGISIKDQSGNFRAPIDIFGDLAEVVAKMPDGIAKTDLLMTAFGRSGAKMIPLLNSGRDGIAAMGQEAEMFGFVMSRDAAMASEVFNDNLARVKDSAKGMVMTFGAAVMPMLNQLTEKLIGIGQKVSAWTQKNPQLASTIGKVALGASALLIGIGATSMVFGGIIFAVGKIVTVFKGLATAFKVVTGVMRVFNLTMFASPITWIVAGVAALAFGAYQLIKHWDKVTAFFKNLWAGVKNIFASVVNWFSGLWDRIKQGVAKGWDVIKNLFLNYTPTGLIIKHWDKIAAFFSRLWDRIRQGVQRGWETIKNLFLNYHPLGLLIKHWNDIGPFFSGLKDRFFEWGQNLITGLWDGIKSIFSRVVEGIKNFGKSIGNGFKSVLGINSPSRVFMAYGLNITQGLVGGMERGEGNVGQASEGLALQTLGGIERRMTSSNTVNSSSISNAIGGATVNYSPVINISGPVTPETKQDFARMLREHAKEIADIMRREDHNRVRLAFI